MMAHQADKSIKRLFLWGEVFSLNSTKSYSVCFIILILYSGIVLAILFSSPCLMIFEYPQDSGVMLEGAWRIICGQRFYTDIHTAHGFLFFGIIALGMKIFGLCGRALIYGPAIVYPVLTLWGWLVAKKRLSSAMSLLFSMMVGTLFIGNYSLGLSGFRESSYAMAYNRLGWSLICILLLQVFLPPRVESSARRTFLEGFSIGIILTFLFFLKPNYFIVALFAILLVPIFLQKTKYLWSGIAAAFVSTSVLFVYLMDLSILAYAQDIKTYSKINISPGLPRRVLELGLANLDVLVLVIIIFALVSKQTVLSGARRFLPDLMKKFMAITAIIIFGVAICAGNYQTKQIPLFSIGAIYLCEDFWRRRLGQKAKESDIPENKLRFLFGNLLSAYLVALIFLPDLGSVVYSLRWRHICNEPNISQLAKIDSRVIKDIRYLVDPISFNLSPDEILDDIRRGVPQNSYHYCFLINDGIRLLRKHVSSHSRIVVMDYTNPFSFPLGLPGSKGDRLDWLYGQTFNNSLYPSPQEVFREASLVMIRTAKFNRPDEMMRIYFPYVEKKFIKIDKSDLWILYGEYNSLGSLMQ